MQSKSEKAQAIIYGSFILYAINALLDKSEQTNMTTIRLKQMLFAKTRMASNKAFVVISNEAWSSVVDKYKDKNYRLAIFQFVESIGFEVEDIMTEMYGVNFSNYISAFAMKQTYDGIGTDILKETRELSTELVKATRKAVYDNKKDL